MDKLAKEQHISFLKGLIDNSEVMILASIEGLNASEISSLRRDLHQAQIGFKVIKNKLAKKAILGTPAESLDADLIGSTAIAWSETDPVGPAKILVKFEKEFEKLKLKSGFNSQKRLDFESIVALSKLPNLEELRSQMLGLFSAPASRLLAQINAPANHVAGVIQARVDKG